MRARRPRSRPCARMSETRSGPSRRSATRAAPRVGDGDRPVAVLHRRVGLGPGTGRLAQLERRLAGQPDRPAAAEEGEPLEPRRGRRAAARSSARSASAARSRRRRCPRARAADRAPRSRSGSARPTARRRTASATTLSAACATGESGTAVIATVGAASPMPGQGAHDLGRRARPREREHARRTRRPDGSSEAGNASVSPWPASLAGARRRPGPCTARCRSRSPASADPWRGRASATSVASARARGQRSGWLAISCSIALISRDFIARIDQNINAPYERIRRYTGRRAPGRTIQPHRRAALGRRLGRGRRPGVRARRLGRRRCAAT